MPAKLLNFTASPNPVSAAFNEIERRRALAQAIGQNADEMPIRSNEQGFAHVLGKGIEAYGNARANRDEKAKRQALADALGGKFEAMGIDPAVMEGFGGQELARLYADMAMQEAQSRKAAESENARFERDQKAARENFVFQKDYERQNPTPAKPTDDMREYEYARSQGFQGTFQDYMTGMKKAGASSVNVGIKDEQEYDKTVGKGYGEKFLDIQNKADSARSALASLDMMEQLVEQPGFYSGAFGDQLLFVKRLGASIGIDPEGISSMETFNALAKQAALENMGGSLGTGFSNADRDFVTDQVPGLQNTAEGNKRLIDITRAINQRKLEIAQFARDYAAQHEGRITADFDNELAKWAEANPLFKDHAESPRAERGPAQGERKGNRTSTGIEWEFE